MDQESSQLRLAVDSKQTIDEFQQGANVVRGGD